ncbi:hypothetical protein JQ543_14275 [Bradyrhizobium diazoefficiens]|nr:hypothetical protein [Bradyrhizobium diazoefficiens]MBR0777495.1 hypothetical protein [Bradyrhizobium diazoefficiens]MBR0848914.1 hypothetical protein [Bradyrhizobium diazoefficiens]
MLPLNDPLWTKLDDAHRDRDIAGLLAELSTSWDEEAAQSLFWDCLCHQSTCYGATYAAVPHLLRIAEVEGNRQQRLEIALFAGYVVQCALTSRHHEHDALPGLPENPDGWDRKLDCFRGLASHLERELKAPDGYISPYERKELLPHYRNILHRGIPDDMDRIRSIKAAFLASLPQVGAICTQALLENLDNENALTPLLGGIASVEGLVDLGRLLFSGSDGMLTCGDCDAPYQYILFGSRVAVYADDAAGSSMRADSRPNLDFREGAASRADGFIVPIENELAPVTLRLLALADRAQTPQPAILLRNFLGSFRCSRCKTSVPVCKR